MIAIEGRHKEVTITLIEAGINLNLKDNHGESALWKPRNGSGKNKDIEKALLKYGAEEYLIRDHVKKCFQGQLKKVLRQR